MYHKCDRRPTVQALDLDSTWAAEVLSHNATSEGDLKSGISLAEFAPFRRLKKLHLSIGQYYKCQDCQDEEVQDTAIEAYVELSPKLTSELKNHIMIIQHSRSMIVARYKKNCPSVFLELLPWEVTNITVLTSISRKEGAPKLAELFLHGEQLLKSVDSVLYMLHTVWFAIQHVCHICLPRRCPLCIFVSVHFYLCIFWETFLCRQAKTGSLRVGTLSQCRWPQHHMNCLDEIDEVACISQHLHQRCLVQNDQ